MTTVNTFDFTAASRTEHAAQAVQGLLDAFGIDEGDHTANTPTRAALAWAHRLSGYNTNPQDHLKTTFTAPPNPGLVISRNIRIQTTCAHHLLPITGTATIAYKPEPGAHIVGLSKLTRLADGYAHRLQVQEQLTAQIVEAIWDELQPQWVACEITAKHGCMTLRGVNDPCTDTRTWLELGEATDGDMRAFWAGRE